MTRRQRYRQRVCRWLSRMNCKKNREQAHTPARTPANNTNTASKVTNKTTAAKPNKAAKKLNFNQQRELDNLPKEIAALEAEQAQLQEKLADGSWFTTDVNAATARQ